MSSSVVKTVNPKKNPFLHIIHREKVRKGHLVRSSMVKIKNPVLQVMQLKKTQKGRRSAGNRQLISFSEVMSKLVIGKKEPDQINEGDESHAWGMQIGSFVSLLRLLLRLLLFLCFILFLLVFRVNNPTLLIMSL